MSDPRKNSLASESRIPVILSSEVLSMLRIHASGSNCRFRFYVISVCLSGVEISGLRGELLDYTLPGF